MARPKTTTLTYFPFDVDFFNDDKIQLIEAEFGIKGVVITIKLLCKIYKENGYFYQWGNDQCLLFAKNAGDGIVSSLVQEVINGLIKRSFFDKGVYDSFKILTSKAIQNRFIKALERSKNIEMTTEYICKNVEIPVNVTLTSINATLSAQRKEKEIKEKETEEDANASVGSENPHSQPKSPKIKIDYQKLIDFFNSNRGNLPEIKIISEPRRTRISAIVKKYGKENLQKVILDAKNSDFIQGNNGTEWRASFDWITQPKNFIKILEGNYKNKENGKPNPSPNRNR